MAPGYLTTAQAAREASDVLVAAGLDGKRRPAVSSRVGMQPLGERERAQTEVTVRSADDYDTAMVALLRAFPDAHGYSGDGRKSIRVARYTGRVVEPGITETQADAIKVLHGNLGRPCPEIAHLTFDEAGDLIMAVRADLRALERMAGES